MTIPPAIAADATILEAIFREIHRHAGGWRAVRFVEWVVLASGGKYRGGRGR